MIEDLLATCLHKIADIPVSSYWMLMKPGSLVELTDESLKIRF